MPLSTFDVLDPNDLLFWDGSHLVFNGTDTVRLFLEVMPRLKSGVMVHIHDISLPFEYFSFFDGRWYAEQYLLAAALLAGHNWQIEAPVCYLKAKGKLKFGGGSFWMRKLG
jgi:hypothetical protein